MFVQHVDCSYFIPQLTGLHRQVEFSRGEHGQYTSLNS